MTQPRTPESAPPFKKASRPDQEMPAHEVQAFEGDFRRAAGFSLHKLAGNKWNGLNNGQRALAEATLRTLRKRFPNQVKGLLVDPNYKPWFKAHPDLKNGLR